MIFTTLNEVIDYHSEIIQIYGGLGGIRDLGLLKSAIEMPKSMMFGQFLHISIFDKTSAYLYHLVRNHPFIDGNKRTATITALVFLRNNNVLIHFTDEESHEFEEIVVQTAQGKISKKEISAYLQSKSKLR